MGLRRDGAETHGAGAESFDYLSRRFHLVDVDAAAAVFEAQQPPQGGLTGGHMVGVFGEPSVGLAAVGAGRQLQAGDGVRVPKVDVAAAPPLELARVGQLQPRRAVPRRVAGLVAGLHLGEQHIEIHPLHPAGGAGEASLHYLVRQPRRLEYLRAFVGLQGGDAHLAHHLQHAFGDALAVARHHALDAGIVGLGQQPVLLGLPQGLESQVGVDAVGAVAHQQTVVMNLPRLAGFHNEADTGALMPPDEMMMNGAAGDKRRQRHPSGGQTAVGEDDDGVAIRYGLRGPLADVIQGGEHTLFAV